VRAGAAEQGELFEPTVVPGKRIGKNLYGTTAIYVYDEADEGAEAACIATLSRAGLAKDVEIASAFGVHRNTVGRMARRLEREGMAAVASTRRGPKGAWKATGDVMVVIASNATLPRKALQELVGKQTGTWLSLSHIYELASAYKPAQPSSASGGRPQNPAPPLKKK
jgi:transposase